MGRPTEVRVRVPASSANLGAGFDSLGLALSLYDEIEVCAAPSGLRVEVEGEGAGRVRCDESHLVVSTMRRTWRILGDAPAGLRLRCRNAIPHSRGLGSSAAAAVAGAVAAAVLSGRDPELERDTLLQITAGMEGHADNAAASLLGGFVIAWESQQFQQAPGNILARFHAVRLDTHPGIHPVALVAEAESSTRATRGLLPEQVPLADAAFTGSRTALAVLAFTQRPELLLAATEDRLHQSYRRPAYPRSAEVVDALRAHGVPAAISGAGPTVLALTSDGTLPEALDLGGFGVRPLPVDATGARVEIG
ncbi:homoserine kinase [Pseudonocardia asaccharolytica]|uniref:Homoserine kinase n=1 Tax=Pseudonocardia asaccharolytica DSM 44247 = NBRC 16224 TaxID=1123024 RepID=A0A511D2B5_9PSEU|nr:homoserine kinase [Pseudonocardia asaccharolytica]GEL18929.1 homoserine kinase [Pseudonocardia asaccharolytica DSM 44247 = NBRC 16224]